jgi:membrane protease YdiL (CAAX protease family)
MSDRSQLISDAFHRVAALARRHPLLAFFVLAYAITWAGVLGLVGASGLRSGQLEMTRGMLVWAAMLAGPSVAGLSLTVVVSGRDGWRDLWQRLTRWRVPARWYAALLVVPAIGSVLVATLWLASPDFAPWILVERDVDVVILMFVALVLGAAVEELGWTGYATPRLRLRFGLLHTALLLGGLHGAWHFLADFAGRGDVSPLLYFPRFVMVWVYEHTESLLLGQLIHASYTAPLFLLTPPAASAAQLLVFWTLFTVAFAAVVILLVRPSTGSRRPASHAAGSAEGLWIQLADS